MNKYFYYFKSISSSQAVQSQVFGREMVKKNHPLQLYLKRVNYE
jgi:hypothetical protein